MQTYPFHPPDGAGTGDSTRPQGDVTPDERVAAAEAQASAAITRYRDLVAAGPGLVGEMVRGTTIEEIDSSAEAARQSYTEISRQIVQAHEQAVPAGNPARSSSTEGAESLKPEAKIALGLRSKR